ncbi:MAG: Gfo/Idh/MocA family oxidoreductase [Acidimicrobiales bacterium]|nr:Gfo/Idh/MocA family oxidoreductase [Acidimicrobiales bacterium]
MLALVTARGGSKGLPRKNVIPVLGRPLIVWTIGAALRAETVTRVVVSTDDDEIAETALAAGAEVPFRRPADLAGDTVRDLPVFRHALEWLRDAEGYTPDLVVHLRPTSPVRPPGLVDRGVRRLAAEPGADSLRVVCEPANNPFKMWRIVDDRLVPLVDSGIPEQYNEPRQALPTVYWQIGVLDVIRPATILEQGSMSGRVILPLVVDAALAVDIDDASSIPRAEEALPRISHEAPPPLGRPPRRGGRVVIAVVGSGSVARRHLTNLLALGRRDLLVVSEQRTGSSLDLDGVEVPLTADLDDALERATEGVVVANVTSRHLDTAARAVQAGRHVYLEKPASVSAHGVDELDALARAQGVTVAVGQQLRFHPLVLALRDLVTGERLGPLLAVQAELGEHLADYHPDEDHRLGYAARRELGGGVLLTQIHQVNVLHWLLGAFDTVVASGGNTGRLGIDVEDTVDYLAVPRSDTPGSGTPGGDAPTPGPVVHGHLDYLQRPKVWTVTVLGTLARAHLDLHAGTLTVLSQTGTADTIPVEQDRNALFVAALEDFFAALAEGRPPRCTLAEATTDLRLVDAIRRSMRSHQVEAIQREDAP